MLKKNVIYIYVCLNLSRYSEDGVVAQCCSNVGPPSATVGQRYRNVEHLLFSG